MPPRPTQLSILSSPERSNRQSISELSLTSTTRATALDVCYSVYGDAPATTDFVDRFYDQHAGYENPFVTASSRSVIGDIHRLSRRMSTIDVPRPLAVLCTLFRLQSLEDMLDNPLFQAIRVWTDVCDISESESFDGHRKAIVEHTLHILLLPGIHCEGPTSHSTNSSDLVSLPHTPTLPTPTPPFVIPSLPVPGTSLSVPSPLHSQLRIITRLSFNEQGLVTHHRDIWDVKDVIGLVPGMSLAQWIGTRLAATGLSYMSRFIPSYPTPRPPREKSFTSTAANSEPTPTSTQSQSSFNVMGIQQV
ncbi:hypothetical protein FA15DRAFT_667978 [Coprinopsis marcescibilis]|uniref:Uncharacterized protein n=1 Tax=Coprinopsis marcescibilis TaxID=230819 RepID=A0A5C3KZD2_COPMA|nr:hypothetical protein FA15DRAFT_667978 [Coprinopsis marcescibilis]